MADSGEQSYRAARGLLLRRNFVPIVLALVPVLLTPFAFRLGLWAFGGEGPWVVCLSLCILISYAALAFLLSGNAWPHQRRGELVVNQRGIFLAGECVIRGEDIVSASVARFRWSRLAVRLRVRRSWRHWFLVVREEAIGAQIIRALGLDAAHARASYVLPWKPFRWGTFLTFYLYLWPATLVALLFGLLASPRAHGDLSPLGSAVAVTLGLLEVGGFFGLWWRSRLEVTFGSDGLWLRQWGKERLVPWNDVLRLEPWPGPLVRGVRGASEGFDVVLRDGERLRLYTARERSRLGFLDGDVVADRLRATMAAAPRRAEAARPALPAPRGIDTRRWISELRRAGAGVDAGFRAPAVDPDELWRVVEDPAVSPRERAAAATALGGVRDGSTRERLRAAASAVALPRLRVAFEAAAEDDDERLASALDQLEARVPTKSRRA